MRAHIIENNVVVNTIEVDSLDFMPNLVNGENGGGIGDCYENGEFIKPTLPALSPEELQAQIVQFTQQRLDDFARTRNYDDIKSACDYAGCSVQKFSIEGQYCKDKRAETWAKLYEILAEVQAGTRPMPTGYGDIEPELPVLVWPTQPE
jgi:hypothetical protein